MKKEKKTSVAGWLVDDHIASYPSSKKAVLKSCAMSWCESSLTLAGWSMVSEGQTLGGESWEGRTDDSPLNVNVPLSAVSNSSSSLVRHVTLLARDVSDRSMACLRIWLAN